MGPEKGFRNDRRWPSAGSPALFHGPVSIDHAVALREGGCLSVSVRSRLSSFSVRFVTAWPLSSEISNTAARTPQRLRLPRQSTRQAPVRPPSRQLSWQVPDVRHVLIVRTGETVSGRVPAEGQNVACMASQVCQRNRIAAVDANLIIR